MTSPIRDLFLLCMIFGFTFLIPINSIGLTWDQQLKKNLGPRDALLVTDIQGTPLISHNSTISLVPASVVKLVTALLALHYLGPEYRFTTDFTLDSNRDLIVKGGGDPLLISEVLDDIAEKLSNRISGYKKLILDDSYFENPIRIPGLNRSTEPYDAPVGALSVNFNTIFFSTENKRLVSAEPQTPLIPFAENHIRASGLSKGRIVLYRSRKDRLNYAGGLIAHFLSQKGIKGNGEIYVDPLPLPPSSSLLHYHSPYALTDVLGRLFEFSNNFIANQLFLSIGAEVFGPPANLNKAVRAASDYLAGELETGEIKMVEGSGISRENGVTARSMVKVLLALLPYRHLMSGDDHLRYKSGTLLHVSSRAGYLVKKGRIFPFVILLNTPGKNAQTVMEQLGKGDFSFFESQP